MDTEFDIPIDFDEIPVTQGITTFAPNEQGAVADFAPDTDGIQRTGPKRPSIPNSAWDTKLVFDLALGIDDLDDILERHQIEKSYLDLLYDNRLFRSEILGLKSEMQKDGVSLRTKARLQAESYLRVMDDMVHDISTTASVRLDTIKQICKLGDVEPKKDSAGTISGEGFNLQINIMQS
jgi:hypothetical protein